MTPWRIGLLVAGVVVALIGLGAGVGGAGMLWADATQRGPDGYLTSPAYALRSDGYALTSDEIELAAPSPQDWAPWEGRWEVRLTAESAAEAPVFLGVARRADVVRYLDGVEHSRLERLGRDAGDTAVSAVTGSGVPAPPGELDIWVASAEGSGRQAVTWTPERGRWAIVVMNADATPGVDVVATAGTEAAFLTALGGGLVAGGLVLLLLAAALAVAATAGTAGGGGSSRASLPSQARPTVYPVAIEGSLDEPLNRGLWLVKWLLLVPHFVVLALLWTAFVLLTFVAGVAILATGRYPRGIFDFNVGVLRWTWRVLFYGYSALGTDRYPPFTLGPVEGYPASLDVAYPERLSRGLVLVKWWLLALPHYIVVAVLAGGGAAWTFGDTTTGVWSAGAGGGLIGLLVLVAGVAVLFTGRYPHGLHELVLGLNRWVYRVVAYAALMTDEYPPFRLDPGSSEPGGGGKPAAGGGPDAGTRVDALARA